LQTPVRNVVPRAVTCPSSAGDRKCRATHRWACLRKNKGQTHRSEKYA
jgi:hypothetical protein